ncbi:transposable element Tcb1 transposase [Trichonephila clavipes]|nr:transposable element Tcb1 transposase [Trichonephila clavipes]
MRICDRWMQEDMTDQRSRSHPPQWTTSRNDRQTVRMAVTDHSVTPRTVAQHIEPVTHHSVSSRTIRRRLQQSGLSARRPLLGLPLTQNPRRLRHQWYDEKLRYAPPHWTYTGYYGIGRYWISLSHSSSTHCRGTLNSQCYISEVLEPVVLPYLQGLSTALFLQDNERPHVAHIVQRFFVNHQIELLLWPDRSPDLSPIENMWSMVTQRLTQITPPAATPDQLWQCVEGALFAVTQEHIQSIFESLPRRVAAVISNNGGYSGY